MPKANRRKQAAKKASARAAVLPSDAALIAAAPDLLAACERVVERWETHDGQMNRIDDVLAAIAKARGD